MAESSVPPAGDVQYNEQGAVVQGVGAGAIRAEEKDMVKRAVVHIKTNDPKLGRGSGFIAELEVSRVEKKIVLMTCNHVLPTLSAAQKATFFFGRDSANKPGTTIGGQELLDSHYFLTDDKDFPGWRRKFDYTVVGVRMDVMKRYLHNEAPTPLSLSACEEMMENEELALNNLLYMIHYPKQPVPFDRYENAEQICRLEGPYIGHMATSYGGSSGSPILREYNNKLIVVGLHRGDLSSHDKSYTYVNCATLITVIVDDIRMVKYRGTFPQVGTFAAEARKHADALKLTKPQQPPGKETKVKPESSQDEQAGPGGQGSKDVLAKQVQDDTGPMQEYNTNALMALKGQLKVKVKMMGLIDDLSKAAGGFLNEVEVLSVRNKPNDFEQMGQVIEILIGKTNGDFNVFCNLLRKWDYAGWANDLETKAREFGGPGTE